MGISFVFPAALWFLVVLVPLWALALATPRRLSLRRFWGSLALRTALISAIVFALAGTQLVSPVKGMTTIFLLDSSDSVSPSARGQAEAFVQDALNSMQPEDRAGVVVFGEQALVERAPSTEHTLGQIASVPGAARTNLQDAVQLGLSLLPAETQKRIVVLSDGGENAGHAQDAAALAEQRSVPISFVDLSTATGGEALVTSLSAPANVRAGQEIELVAEVESTDTQGAQLRMFNGDQPIYDQQVQLQPGTNRFSLKVKTDGQGFQNYRAEITPQIDGRAQNNIAETVTKVAGAARVLLVEGQQGSAAPLQNALTAANVQSDIVVPQQVPGDIAGLGNYDGVVLINVAARDLPPAVIETLPLYVRELGKGLVMIGGDHSYGVGGYGKTPIEEALPVYMDVRNREERPDLALVFVIDKSGSMDACHCSGPNRQSSQQRRGGTPKIDIAKDAVLQASSVLRPEDTVGVVAFDQAAHWVLNVQQNPASDIVQKALAPVAPDGTTNVRAGLQAAEDALLNTDAKIKHVILLTDGWSGSGDNFDIAQRMRNEGMTLSVIAAGTGSAEYLHQLAQAGAGRYYPVDNMSDVPQVFVQETITAVGNYLIEEPFTPAYGSGSPIMEGLTSGLPQLYGYNGTTLKETATAPLLGIDNAPVLAQWQYGLGRSVAWTSDAEGRWAKDWLAWDKFPQFAAQMIGWTLPTTSNSGISADFRSEGAQTILNVQASDLSGKPRDNMALKATLVSKDGSTRQVPLQQVGPGQYRASVDNPIQGSYMVQIVGSEDNQIVAQETTGLVVPYSPEYRQSQSNPQLLQALADTTGGTRLNSPADAFAPLAQRVSTAQDIGLPLLALALLLLPLDIAIRRLMLRRSDLRWPQRSTTPPAPPSPPAQPADPALERLLAARQRARRRISGEE